MNRRLAIPQRPTSIRSEDSSSLRAQAEGDEATIVQFGFEEVTIVGDDEPIVMSAAGMDGDEPTLEYPRCPLPPKPKRSEWYVRLRLTEDRIAKLWVRRLAPLDVLVWWEEDQAWAPLLSVPEMRAAIAAMREKEEYQRRARHELRSPAVAPMAAIRDDEEPRPDEPHHEVGLQQSTWVEEWRRRVAAEARMTPAVRALISGAQRGKDPASVLRPKEIRPPPSSLPPVVVDVAPPEIPPAPKVPQIEVPSAAVSAPAVSEPALTAGKPAPAVASPAPSQTQRPSSAVGSTERVLWLVAAAVLTVLVLASRRPLTVVQPSEPPVQAAPVASIRDTPVVRPSTTASSPVASRSTRDAQPVPSPSTSASPRVGKVRSVASPATKSTTTAPTSVANAVASVEPPRPTVRRKSFEVGGFDPAAARRALVSAAHQVGYCGEGRVSGAVVVTFAPSGFVQNVSLARLQGENVRADCVLRAFQAVRLMPYSGSPVTVSKSFRVN